MEKMYHYFMLKSDEFYEHYHKWSNVKTIVHMILSKFGGSIKTNHGVSMMVNFCAKEFATISVF